MTFQSHLGAGMHVWELEQAKKLIFRRGLVICNVSCTENEPAFFPCLCSCLYKHIMQKRTTEYMLTLRLSPFFHRYPVLITVSSTALWDLAGEEVFHPPSPSSNSSSESSAPLPSLRSAIGFSECGVVDAPGIAGAARVDNPPLGDTEMSGDSIESESDSFPELIAGGNVRFGGACR